MVKEIFMSQFTTSTTCYSGARDANTLRFATEHHSLRLILNRSGLSEEQVDHPVVTWESLRDDLHDNHVYSNESMVCVGQSSCTTIDGGDCQVVCFLQSGVEPHQQIQSTGAENASSTSTAAPHATDGMPQSRHHQRRLTHDGALTTTVASAAAMFHNSSDGLSIANNTFQRSSWAHQHPPQHVTTSTTGADRTTSLLRLTVSKRPCAVSTEYASNPLSIDNDATLLLERYTSQPLPFRPLAPCVSQLWITATESSRTTSVEGEFRRGNDDNSSICVTGVWVGSADDNLLRLFLPDDSGTLEEKRRLGDHAGFLFQSPVMALDFFLQEENNNQKRNRLAVACQDGTIRLLGFQCHGTEHAWTFANVEEYTVIVDGPIVCLHWNHQPEQPGTMQVVAGSLCGYVCSLQMKSDQSTWQGPTMVAQGFWDSRLQTEDSVLAVHCHGNYLAFGTYSGKVWVYAFQSSSGDYQIAWKCQLHYPIHGVCFVPTSLPHSSSHSTIELVVTTRRTLHILQHQQAKLPPILQPRYSAELAKQRLERLLAERNVLSCSTDFVTLGPDELQNDEPDDVWILL